MNTTQHAQQHIVDPALIPEEDKIPLGPVEHGELSHGDWNAGGTKRFWGMRKGRPYFVTTEKFAELTARKNEDEARRREELKGTLRGEALTMLYQARSRSRDEENGICTLTVEDIERKIIETCGICPILKIAFQKHTKFAMSIDRVIPELKYIAGNIRIIALICNELKGAGTDPEVLRKLGRWKLFLEAQNAADAVQDDESFFAAKVSDHVDAIAGLRSGKPLVQSTHKPNRRFGPEAYAKRLLDSALKKFSAAPSGDALTIADVLDLLARAGGRCPVTGVRFARSNGVAGTDPRDRAVLHVIVASRGLVRGNVRIVSIRASEYAHNVLTSAQIFATADYIASNQIEVREHYTQLAQQKPAAVEQPAAATTEVAL